MIWLTNELVLAIHRRQIAEHGGTDGVRDLGLLDSALARPKNVEAYESDADLARLASSYAYGIVKNHPFLDGNKRTGYVVMETFIVLNGSQLTSDFADKYATFIALASGDLTEEELTDWLRERISPA